MSAPAPAAATRLPVGPTTALGITVVVAYGIWLYGFGVLIGPMAQETGWTESSIATAYGSSLLVSGIAGLWVGKGLDHRGSRPTLLVVGLIAGVALFAAAGATNPVIFAVLAAIGGGLVGAGGYYGATSAIMARLVPARRAEGITRLTLFGAFSSPLALPIIAEATTRYGWRPALRGSALAICATFVITAFVVPNVHAHAQERPRLRQAIRDAVVPGRRRGLALAGVLSGAATSVVIVQQVPAMVEAGMALSVASGFAGARGLLQLVGRLPLPPVIKRFGARRTLLGAYALTGVSAFLLIDAGTSLQATLFAIVGGASIGALAAAEGIYAAEVYDGPTLATLLGMFSLARGVGAALGPIFGGLLLDLTDSRLISLTLGGLAGLAGAWMLRANRALDEVSSSLDEAAGADDSPPSTRPASTSAGR